MAITIDYQYKVGDKVRVPDDPRDGVLVMAAPLSSLDYDYQRRRQGTAFYRVRFEGIAALAGRHYFGKESLAVYPEHQIRHA